MLAPGRGGGVNMRYDESPESMKNNKAPYAFITFNVENLLIQLVKIK